MNIAVPEGTNLYLIEVLDSNCSMKNFISNDINYATKEAEKLYFDNENIMSISITDLKTDKVQILYQRSKLLEKFVHKYGKL